MRIKHHIRIHRKPQLCNELGKRGISVIPRNGDDSFFVDVEDSDPLWPEIRDLAHSFSAWVIDVVEYTRKDVESAEWLFAHAVGDAGYPKPEKEFGYLRETFDLENYCFRCGVGRIQRGPYRLGSEPKAKTIQFSAPQWDHQTIFARKAVQKIFEGNGVSGLTYLPVTKHRTGAALETIIQLLPKATLPSGLVVDGQRTVTCKVDNEELRSLRETPRDPRVSEAAARDIQSLVNAWPRTFTSQTPYCGRVKYHPPYSRYPVQYQATVFDGAPDFILSTEWFGSGGAAAKQVIVSRKVARIILEQRWKGLRLEPVQLLSDGNRALH